MDTKETDVSGIVKNVVRYGMSPALLQRDALALISKTLDNEYGIISAENPGALLLEMSAMQTAGNIGKSWLLTRRLYPVSAQTHEDLYPHLSDLDWVGVFGLPAQAQFVISFSYDEILQMMRPLPDGSGSLLRIPRGMRISVGDVDFLIDYPIDIKQLKHGGFKVTYDTTEKSPIQTLKSNIAQHEVAAANQGAYRLNITVDAIQAREITIEDSIVLDNKVNIQSTFSDYYYYCRVYHGDDRTGWKEIKTTHAPDIYDVNSITAVLKLIENAEDYTLNVSVPLVYNRSNTGSNGIVYSTMGARIKLEIYTTIGEVTMNLENYTIDQFTYDFNPKGKGRNDNLSEYSSALTGIKDCFIFSRSFISQGRDPLTFSELRDRVVNNTTGPNLVPVSNRAIADKLQDNQFKVIKVVDYVTTRDYWATRPLPYPTNESLLTPAAASIETLITSTAELLGIGTVIDNDKRITITPDTIYRMENGKLKLVDKSEVTRINQMNAENKARMVNSHEYYYSPFHYVVDGDRETVKLRPYYLDNPKAITKYYKQSNEVLDTSLTISDTYMVYKTERGYTIRIEMQSNDAYKNYPDEAYWAQILLSPHGDKDNYVYLQGRMVGRNRNREPIFEFNVDTRFDVDSNDRLILTNFSFRNSGLVNLPVDLETEYNFLFGLYGNVPKWSRTELDNIRGTHLLEQDAKAILLESIRIRLGHSLKYLWTRARTYADDIVYEKHTTDVPLLYSEDVYDTDAVTGSKVNVVNGKVTYNLRHRKGSPVLDAKGQPVYLHRVGDTKKDSDGKPIIKEPRKIVRRLEIMLIDGAYWFATDDITRDYREELVETFIDWLTDDLKETNENTLEETRIRYYPSATMGQINVIYNEGIATMINASQSLRVNLTVSSTVAADMDVRKKISESTIAILNEEMGRETVSKSTIIARLVKEYGDDVIGCTINNFGGDDAIVSFTVMDEGKRATLKKRLTVLPDERLTVEEDVLINFIEHSKRGVDIDNI